MATFTLGGIFLSGDDPATSDWEGWDPAFSRWPKWSELYIYSQVRERGVGYWTNLGMWQAETGFSPRKNLDFRVTYYHMDAFHPFPGGPKVFGTGTQRGDNAQIRMDFALNRYMKGHVLYEDHVPGNFYSAANNGYFLRFEMSFLIKANPSVDDVKHWFGK